MKPLKLLLVILSLILGACQPVQFDEAALAAAAEEAGLGEGFVPGAAPTPAAPVTPGSPLEPVDTACGSNGLSPGGSMYVPYRPLASASSLPHDCRRGFEFNNLTGKRFEVAVSLPAGSREALIDYATYTAPDDLQVLAVLADGRRGTVMRTCRVSTADYADPTAGKKRPPADSIRQFRITLPAQTVALSFELGGARTPFYMRVLGLCDYAPAAGLRAVP